MTLSTCWITDLYLMIMRTSQGPMTVIKDTIYPRKQNSCKMQAFPVKTQTRFVAISYRKNKIFRNNFIYFRPSTQETFIRPSLYHLDQVIEFVMLTGSRQIYQCQGEWLACSTDGKWCTEEMQNLLSSSSCCYSWASNINTKRRNYLRLEQNAGLIRFIFVSTYVWADW